MSKFLPNIDPSDRICPDCLRNDFKTHEGFHTHTYVRRQTGECPLPITSPHCWLIESAITHPDSKISLGKRTESRKNSPKMNVNSSKCRKKSKIGLETLDFNGIMPYKQVVSGLTVKGIPMKNLLVCMVFLFGCGSLQAQASVQTPTEIKHKKVLKTKVETPKILRGKIDLPDGNPNILPNDQCPELPENYDFTSEAALKLAAIRTLVAPRYVPPAVSKVLPDGTFTVDVPFTEEENCTRMTYVANQFVIEQNAREKQHVKWLFGTCSDWEYSFVVQTIQIKEQTFREVFLRIYPVFCGRYAISIVQVLADGVIDDIKSP